MAEVTRDWVRDYVGEKVYSLTQRIDAVLAVTTPLVATQDVHTKEILALKAQITALEARIKILESPPSPDPLDPPAV